MRVVKKINALKKDLLVVTGDFITSSVNGFWKRWMPPIIKGHYISRVRDVLDNLEGDNKIAVLGNHDQWDGLETEQHLVNELKKIGFRVLRNSSEKMTRDTASIYIAGTDDFWFSFDLIKALRNIPRNSFKILLSHNPDVTEDVHEDMKIDLTLCGHTHGGQVVIPILTRHFTPIRDPYRYLAGLVKEDYGYTYVNRGIGTLVFPLRIGAPPEITCFTLRAGMGNIV